MKKFKALNILGLLLPLGVFGQSFDLSSLPTNQRAELRQKFPELGSASVPGYVLDRLVRHLGATGSYQSIQIIKRGSGENSIYRLQFVANKLIEDIGIRGNRNVTEEEILESIDWKKGDYFQEQNITAAKGKILELYRRKAFLDSQVDITETQSGRFEVQLMIDITEGPRSKISEFSVTSSNEDLNREIKKKLKSFRGDAITDPNLSEIRDLATNFLRKEGYYQATLAGPQIQINDQKSAKLTYEVQKPIKFNVSLRGNQSLSTIKLIQSLELDDFFSTNPSMTKELENRLEQYYLKRGYAHIQIESHIEDRPDPHLKAMVFEIDEGPLVRINSFEIKGSTSRSSRHYSEIIREEASEIVRQGYYNRQDIDEALSSLVIRLQNEGFLQAKVISLRSEYSSDRSEVTLILNLNEGPLTQVQELVFTGNNSISDLKLRELISLKAGAPLKLQLLEEGLENIKNYYRSQGFLEAQIKNEKKKLVLYSNDFTRAQVLVQIEEGPKVQVADILLEGNEISKDYVILNELEFERGDVLTPEKIEESLRRLQRGGLFSSIEIRTLEEGTPIANRTVIVSVTERKPGLLNFGAGLTNERGLSTRGYTGLAYRNIQGTGRSVTTRIDGNYNVSVLQYPEYQLAAGYLEPYLLNSRVSGRLNISRLEEVEQFETDSEGEPFDINVVRIDQMTLSLEKNFTSNILARWNLLEISRNRQLYINSDIPNTTRDIASIGPTVDFDFRDHPFNPTSGSHSKLSAEYSSPFLGSSPTIEYFRATASYTQYWNVWSQVIWVNSLRGGYLTNLSDRDDGGIPFDTKGFTLGGASTIRGFDANRERFPLPRELSGNASPVDYLLKENSFFHLLKSEFRFPIYGALGGAIFYDAGRVTVTDSTSGYENPFKSSVGIAFRIGTPVGPINFEWGFKINPKAERGEDPSHLHFSIGSF